MLSLRHQEPTDRTVWQLVGQGFSNNNAVLPFPLFRRATSTSSGFQQSTGNGGKGRPWGGHPTVAGVDYADNKSVTPNTCVLIAEDNDADVLTIRRAFKQLGFPLILKVVENGADAIAYLKGDGDFGDRSHYPVPDLLLLDLKMPGTNGFEVLQWVREQDDEIGSLRVVVLTTSDAIKDVNRAYQLGANSFLTKPLNFTEFKDCLDAIARYWLCVNQRPEKPRQLGQVRLPSFK